jgi:hypothetical protein
MPLLADLVGFREPGGDFVIDLIHGFEPKRVEMISRRESLNPPETRMLETTRQDDVAVHPVSANDERRETHAHVKGDARLFGQNSDRPILAGNREQFVKDSAHAGRFAAEM